MERDGGGVVMQLVEIDGELADGVDEDGQGEGREIGVEEAVEAAADAVVVEHGRVVCKACLCPLGASIRF
jgi:hypothetical protein